jgi:hypothetical protein
MTQQRQNPLSDFKLTDAGQARQQILDELRAVKDVVAGKATPEETTAFSQWLLATAQAAADAAKEGGFMGFGAVQVSEGEQAMLDRCAPRRRITRSPRIVRLPSPDRQLA